MDTPPALARHVWRAVTLLLALVWVAAALQTSRDAEVLGRWSQRYAALLAGLAALVLLLALGCRASVLARVWRARLKLMLLAGSALAASVAAEVGLRLADPLGLAYHDQIARYIELREDDPVLAYVQPSSRSVELDGVTVNFNAHGLRGPEILAKGEDELRILVLGDSVAFGWGVAEEQLLGARLAQLIGEQLARPVRAINAGVCSYNTEQERLYLEQRGFDLEPDLVVLVLVDNDVVTYGERWQRAEGRPRPPFKKRVERWLQGSYLVRTLDHVLAHGAGGVELEGVERAVAPGDHGWERNLQALSEIATLCDERDVPLGLFHFRWRSDPWSDALLHAARARVAPRPVFDTAAWWDEYDLRQLVNSVTDSHPNAAAHELTARRMLAALEESNLLPKP